MTVISKNLGQVSAIWVGLNPPRNIMMLWYNQNNNLFYYYDTTQDEWIQLTGSGGGGTGNGVVLLSKTTIPLAPILRLTFTGKTGGSFLNSDTVTDSNGSTGIVLSATGGSSGSIIFSSVNFASGYSTFSGILTDGGVTATAGTYTWDDVVVNLNASGAQSNYIGTDLLLTNVQNSNGTVRDLQFWSGAGRTGNQFFKTNNGMSDALSTILSNSSSYIRSQDGDIVVCQNPKIWLPQTIYATVGTIDTRSIAKLDVLVYGYLQQ
jgi:hypothetical protein